MITRVEWAKAFLEKIDAPIVRHNLWTLVSWMQAEGGSAKFNPLNTTQKMPGSTNYNSIGVQNFVSFDQGVEANAKTILQDKFGYPSIVDHFRSGDRAVYTLRAIEGSNWGTGGIATQCLYWVKKYWNDYSTKPIGQ